MRQKLSMCRLSKTGVYNESGQKNETIMTPFPTFWTTRCHGTEKLKNETSAFLNYAGIKLEIALAC